MEHLQPDELLVGDVQILREREGVRIPVEIPRHVAQRDRIHAFAAVCGHIGSQIGGKVVELGDVAGPVGEMYVAEHEDLEGVLIDLFEREIGPFYGRGGAFEPAVQERKYAGRGHFVAAGDGDEDISPFFLRPQLIDSLLVGSGYLDAVGDHDIGYGALVGGYDAVNGRAGIGFDPDILDDADIELSEILFSGVPFDGGVVVTRFALIGHADGKAVGRGADDGTDVGDAGFRFQQE